MVNAAWVTPFPPDRHGGGGQIRQAHLLLGLAEQASIHLLCPGPVNDAAVCAAVTSITVVDKPDTSRRREHPWRRRADDLLAVARAPEPIEVRAFAPYRQALAPQLTRVTEDSDVVLVEYAGLAPLLPARRAGPWVLTLHNLPSRMSAQQAAVLPHRRQRWLLRRDAQLAAEFERVAVADFDATVVCTAADAAALASREHFDATRSPLVVPNGVDAGRFPLTRVPARPRLVFTGALDTAPNLDGAVWFCQSVLPLVRAEVPSVQVDLVGARPGPAVSALGALPGVSVHADVAAVDPFLTAARLAVVPLRIGSGSRLKALEAMAANRPVVGTSIGLEGLDLRPGHEVLVADHPADFAAAVVRLLADDALADRLAGAGRAVACARFDWTPIAATFAQSMVDLAERWPTAS